MAHRFLVVAALAALAGPAAASSHASSAPGQPVSVSVLTYEMFEATVNHADLPECPKALAATGRFCRVVLHGDALHVFAFSEEGDQPLQAVMDYPLDAVRFPD